MFVLPGQPSACDIGGPEIDDRILRCRRYSDSGCRQCQRAEQRGPACGNELSATHGGIARQRRCSAESAERRCGKTKISAARV
jgi:hypothetical protein